ncbi:hypothetical protein GO013_07265 [Pseudodesulfovibrio sp. JC047]|uniref:hypothetical protein n=1 Tax=Pseudodesulfovibrio sp. JC047 TaxID=2683199 RepID=UPI0013D41A86|nr:hypothetical protein [Pseudodesulfovibrio sp. JC047]NDV19217.1 hypothetical protein [Pseudodesulfovibrio sp. JC047]
MKNGFSKTLFGGATALETFGQIDASESAWKTAVFNSRQAHVDAQRTKDAGARTLEQFLREARHTMGQEVAVASHQGGTGGSAQFILADLANQLEKQAENIRTDTANQIDRYNAESEAHARSGANSRRQGYLKTAGTLMKHSYEFLNL